ncbi:hypothetical protein [Halomonas saccharevitans]|uniref:hypothetical protein n=1 Tax=Halomonas saccharevitans TaxID=416872 RepID=UPI001C3176C1|nr:hypothetical protein [Halomonas saccharevitans]
MAAQEQNEIGYGWLARRYDVEATQPFPVTSRIGRTRHTHEVDGGRQETYLEAMRPADTLSAHLTFALKHEGVHLEFLARLFEVIPEQLLADWVRSEPTGQYARRAGFLYEWLTGRQLDIDEVGATIATCSMLDITSSEARRSGIVAGGSTITFPELPTTARWCARRPWSMKPRVTTLVPGWMPWRGSSAPTSCAEVPSG